RRAESALGDALPAPAVLLVLGVLAYPVAWEVAVSLTNFASRVDGGPAWVGLAHYGRMLGQEEFRRGLATTVLYLAGTTMAKLILGLGIALLLARPSRGRAL